MVAVVLHCRQQLPTTICLVGWLVVVVVAVSALMVVMTLNANTHDLI